MKQINGIAASDGITIGKMYIYRWALNKKTGENKPYGYDAENEMARFRTARDKAVRELEELADTAQQRIGKKDSEIFDMQAMLLMDQAYEDEVKSNIHGGRMSAEQAVKNAGESAADRLNAAGGSEYIRERSADIIDVSDRVIMKLYGENDGLKDSDVLPADQLPENEADIILVADDLTPAETVQLDTSRIHAFVTSRGSAGSHTSIIAGTLGIPAVAGTGINVQEYECMNGHECIVDGGSGLFIIDPDDKTRNAYSEKIEGIRESRTAAMMNDLRRTSKDDTRIKISANAGSIPDIGRASANGAEGIGLFRSEFLFIGEKEAPSEEEQFDIYKKAAKMMDGREVVIRTADIGADKRADYLNLPHEENPAMGMRGIRLCFKYPQLLKTQLRAIYRAGAFGNISVMFPMITSVQEVDRILQITDEVKDELSAEGTDYADIRRGIMIETPAAALISDDLAKKVDFFSIGTNDLTQYTLASDRQNAEICALTDTHHPAVMKLIEMTAKSAHKNDIDIGICGELASDTDLTAYFISIGIDVLSVSSSKIPLLRKHINEL